MRLHSTIMLLFLLPQLLWATRITGYVEDANSGEGLIGANVVALKTTQGAATNLDGYFVLSSLPPGVYELRASYQGYHSRSLQVELQADQDQRVVLQLKPAVLELEALVVTLEENERELQQRSVYAGQVRLDKRRLEMAPPLIERDLVRAFLTVPGVLPSNDYSSELNVRGSRSDENLYQLDGVEIYNPNHLGGIFSTFIPSSVKHADLLRSGWPARFGGRTGGVLSVAMREGNRKELDGEVTLGALSSSVTVSGPLAGVSGTSWLIAGRRSYLDLATSLFSGSSFPYYFSDAQGRFNWDASSNDRISTSFYLGQDNLGASSLDIRFGNRAGILNWRHIWNTRVYSRAILSHTRFLSRVDFGGRENVFEESLLQDWSGRLTLEVHPTDGLYLETGIGFKHLRNSYEYWELGQRAYDEIDRMNDLHAYLSASWQPHSDWLFEPGLRVSRFQEGSFDTGITAYHRWAPRLAVKHFLREGLRLKAAWGLYHQAMQQLKRDGSSFDYVWTLVDESAPPSSSSHLSAGLEADLGTSASAEIEVYHKQLQDIVEAQNLDQQEKGRSLSNRDRFWYGRGEAFGADFTLQRNEGLWTGKLSYSLAWAVREFPAINNGEAFYAAYDTRQTGLLILDRAFTHERMKPFPFKYLRLFRYNRSNISMTVRYADGPRYTEPSALIYLGDEGLNRGESVIQEYGERNAAQLPAYSRVDLAWTWMKLKESYEFELRIGLLNVFNSPNYYSIEFDDSDPASDIPELVRNRGVSRLPSLELTWRFK